MVPPRAITLLFLLLSWELLQKLGRCAPRALRYCVPQSNTLGSCELALVVVAVVVVCVVVIFIFNIFIIFLIVAVVGSVSSSYRCGSASSSGGSSSSNGRGARNVSGNDTVAHHLGAISSILWQAAVK